MAKAWSPFYWGDYIADTGHLTLAEHGAYLLLMGHYYRTGQPIPADMKKVHRICRCLKREDKRAAESVVAQFFAKDGDVYRQGRIDEELAKSEQISKEYKARAGKAAAARWSKDASNKDAWSDASSNAPSNASSIPQAMLGDAQSQSQPQIQKNKILKPSSSELKGSSDQVSASPSQEAERLTVSRVTSVTECDSHDLSHQTETETKTKKESKPSNAVALPDWIPLDPWTGFLEMRKKMRSKLLTDRAITLIVKELGKLREQGYDVAEVLDQSTRNNWKDVFPVRENQRPAAKQKPGQVGRMFTPEEIAGKVQ